MKLEGGLSRGNRNAEYQCFSPQNDLVRILTIDLAESWCILLPMLFGLNIRTWT